MLLSYYKTTLLNVVLLGKKTLVLLLYMTYLGFIVKLKVL